MSKTNATLSCRCEPKLRPSRCVTIIFLTTFVNLATSSRWAAEFYSDFGTTRGEIEMSRTSNCHPSSVSHCSTRSNPEFETASLLAHIVLFHLSNILDRFTILLRKLPAVHIFYALAWRCSFILVTK